MTFAKKKKNRKNKKKEASETEGEKDRRVKRRLEIRKEPN